MNAVAVAALVLLAVAQDPRAFRMPKKPAEPPKAEQEQPAREELPVPNDPLPAAPAGSQPAPETETDTEPDTEPAPVPAPENEPAPESQPEPEPQPATDPATDPAPEPAPATTPQKSLMFELPKPAGKNEAAPATGNGPRSTGAASPKPATPKPATPERAGPAFTLPNQPAREKKPKTPRPFRLPDKNDVSN